MSDEKEELEQEEESQVEETSEEQSEVSEDETPDIFSMSDEEYEEYVKSQEQPVTQGPSRGSEEEAEEGKTPAQERYEKSSKKVEEPDYKAFYEQMFKPFKANGTTYTPRNAADIIALMQQGANYTKKMQALAPVKRAAETLRKAKIDEDELNFLIDVRNGNKDAIKKLIKDKNIDLTEFDPEEEVNYSPSNYIASDKDVAFSDVVRDVQDSLPKIRDILDSKWDEESKRELVEHPELLNGLHEEIQLGRFDKIQEILENERAFGRYKGVCDIKAYSDIVTKLVYAQHERMLKQANNQKQEDTKERRVSKAKAAPAHNRPANTRRKLNEVDLANMSDEDFLKIMI